MSRSKSSPLSVKARRLEFAIAKKAVFESLGDGVSIGYRRNQSAGTWIARRSDGKGGSWQKVIGTADDYADPDGIRVLSWAQAQSRAFDAAKTLGTPSSTDQALPKLPVTVAKALDRYEADLKTRGGDAGNVQRLRCHLDSHILGKAISNLTAGDLREWRDGLVKKRAAATVNRTANAFKAALNLAADNDDAILTRNPWEKGLASIPDAEEARNVILANVEVRKIIETSYKESGEFGHLVEVVAVTGARYGQTAGLLVSDLQDDRNEPRLMMPSAKKGKGTKRVLRRPVPIPAALAKKLRKAAGDRPDTAPLLLKPARPQTKAEKQANIPAPPPAPWRKSDHYRPFKRAVAAAFKVEEGTEQPADHGDDRADDPITIYALRHSSIVRQILAGMPVRVVAVMHDTSVAMIEKNYSTHLADHTDAIARAAMLDLDAPDSQTVVKMHTRAARN